MSAHTTENENLTWTQDGDDLPGGDVGGDIQVGESLSRRYVPDAQPHDGTYAFITTYLYPVQYDENDTTFAVQRMDEYVICTDPSDPGMSEVRSDYRYDEASGGYSTIDEAEAALPGLLAQESGANFSWDGRSDID